jgi:DNA repair protein RadC
VNSSQVRVSELLREAVRQNCPALVLVHNHPSGDPAPSADDVSMTSQTLEAARLLNIDVLDHLIIGHQRWVSLREKGLAFA